MIETLGPLGQMVGGGLFSQAALAGGLNQTLGGPQIFGGLVPEGGVGGSLGTGDIGDYCHDWRH